MGKRIEAEFIDGFYVVGDLAYLPEEWERLERERDRRRKRDRAYMARYRAENGERLRYLKREHMRRKRMGEYRKVQIIASLHDLRCVGPTRETGCRCKKTLIAREVAS